MTTYSLWGMWLYCHLAWVFHLFPARCLIKGAANNKDTKYVPCTPCSHGITFKNKCLVFPMYPSQVLHAFASIFLFLWASNNRLPHNCCIHASLMICACSTVAKFTFSNVNITKSDRIYKNIWKTFFNNSKIAYLKCFM